MQWDSPQNDLISQNNKFYETKTPRFSSESLEATAGFEPAIEVLQTFALPLGYVAIFN